MNISDSICIDNRADWRAWLEAHHAAAQEVWLIFYKKKSGRPSIPLEDAIEEALCFGWIDSLIQRIDEERYARLFTPRTNQAKWSPSNRRRVQKLMGQGRMSAAGLALLPPDWQDAPMERPHPECEALPEFVENALDAIPGLRECFEELPPSLRRNYLGYVLEAKREETRQRRLAYILDNLIGGIRVDLMRAKLPPKA